MVYFLDTNCKGDDYQMKHDLLITKFEGLWKTNATELESHLGYGRDNSDGMQLDANEEASKR